MAKSIKINKISRDERIQEEWDLAHLDLDHTSQDLVINNPFDNMTDYDVAHPDEHLLSLMMRPEYFGWTCKKLF
jgi:hypothetical protein